MSAVVRTAVQRARSRSIATLLLILGGFAGALIVDGALSVAFAVMNGCGATLAFSAHERDAWSPTGTAFALGSWTLLALNHQSTHVAVATGVGFVWFVLRTEEEIMREAYRGE